MRRGVQVLDGAQLWECCVFRGGWLLEQEIAGTEIFSFQGSKVGPAGQSGVVQASMLGAGTGPTQRRPTLARSGGLVIFGSPQQQQRNFFSSFSPYTFSHD